MCCWFFTINDLPIQDRKIDVGEVKQCLAQVGGHSSPYLSCCAFQANFAHFFETSVPFTSLVTPQLLTKAKHLLQNESSTMLSLSKWTTFFQLIPLEVPVLEAIYRHMLCGCKITKLWEVNFKILSHT